MYLLYYYFHTFLLFFFWSVVVKLLSLMTYCPHGICDIAPPADHGRRMFTGRRHERAVEGGRAGSWGSARGDPFGGRRRRGVPVPEKGNKTFLVAGPACNSYCSLLRAFRNCA